MVKRSALQCAVAFIVASLALQLAQAETIDRVLAVAAGQIITLSDVTFAREFGLVAPVPGADPIRAMLSPLIDRELVLVEVDRYAPPEPAADAIDRELDAVRARFAGRDAFAAALARAGVDETHVREAVRHNLRIRAYQDQRFSPADPRRQALIDEWLAGLRRRGDVADLYLSGR
jgi:hypothetical protein